MSNIRVGDNGTIFIFTIKDDVGIVDIQGATVEVTILSDDGKIVKQGTITDGLSGKCQIILDSIDIPKEGIYILQGQVTFQDGKIFNSDIETFKVERKL